MNKEKYVKNVPYRFSEQNIDIFKKRNPELYVVPVKRRITNNKNNVQKEVKIVYVNFKI